MNKKSSKYQIDRLMKVSAYMEFFHIKEFKMVDIVHNDLYRHMNDAGLFDYNHIIRGKKGVSNPSKTDLVFFIWLMIARDLKDFGMVKLKLHKVKDYLLEEFNSLDILNLPTNKEDLLELANGLDFENNEIKNELIRLINSGELISKLKERNFSRMFITLYNMLIDSMDIKLIIDSDGTAVFVNERKLSGNEINKLSYQSKIILPMKKYLLFFIGTYASDDFLIRSEILNENDVRFLNELKRNDISSLIVKYHKKKDNTYMIKQFDKIEIQYILSELLLKGEYQDIIIKTKIGYTCYSELISETNE